MPWQQYVADVGNELLPSGLPAYREVIVTVMRQQGKTTIILAHSTERCTLWDTPQRVAYTAQTGSDARKKLLNDQVPILEKSPFKSAIRRVNRAQGNEGIVFRNGSRVDVLASSVSAGHGGIVDLAEIDEAFDDLDDRREQTMVPAMMTRPHAQLLISSTMGTDASVYLNRKIEAGRAAALSGADEGIAYFEWAIPNDADIDDPRVWARHMPAYGFTITEAVVAHARTSMTDGEFRRAFGNQRTRNIERVIPDVTWALACSPAVAPPGRLSWAVDVAPDRDWAGIASAGAGVVEPVDYRPGTSWLVPELARLKGRHGMDRVTLDVRGPAGALVAEIERAGITVHEASPADVVVACGQMFDRVVDGKGPFIRRTSEKLNVVLDAAVAGVSKQTVGDAFRWARKGSTDISLFMAVTLAGWADATQDTDEFFVY